MFLNSLLAEKLYAFDVAEPIILWVTVGILSAVILGGVLMFFLKKNAFGKYVKYSTIGLVFYALVEGILMLALNIAKHEDPAYLDKNWVDHDVVPFVFVPILVLCVATLLFGTIFFLLNRSNVSKKAKKIATFSMVGLLVAGFIAVMVCVGVYYVSHIQDGGYYETDTTGFNQVVLYVCAAALVICSILTAFLVDKDKTPFNSHSISLAGITVALSFALSYVKMWEMPQGGSITLASLLPVMLFAYLYGPKKGLLVGFVYGTLQAVQDPYIIHPAQFLLDYPIAFSMVAFAGVFKNVKALKFEQVKFTLGAILVGVLRFASHVLSGVFAFGAYAQDAADKAGVAFDGAFAWVYSLSYNSFVFVDLAFVVVLGALLLSSKAFINQMEQFSKKK